MKALLAVLLVPGFALAQTTGQSRMSTPTESARTQLNTQTITSPIPAAGRFLLRGSLDTSGIAEQQTHTKNGVETKTEFAGATFGPTLNAAYGITENVFVGVDYAYHPGKTDRTVTTSYAGKSEKATSTVKTQGLSEPVIRAGATFETSPNLRVTGELKAALDVGDKRISSNTNSRTIHDNGLAGGASYTPQVSAVAATGPVKLYGELGYTVRDTRDIERNYGTSVQKFTLTGANSRNLAAGVEFPRAANLGFKFAYNYFEKESTKIQGRKIGETRAFNAYNLSGYVGIPLGGSFLVPELDLAFNDLKKKDGDVHIRPALVSTLRVQMVTTF